MERNILKRLRKRFQKEEFGDKNPCYNKIWIVKDKQNKRINLLDLDKYIKEGWKKGRYVSNETRRKQSEAARQRDEKGRFI